MELGDTSLQQVIMDKYLKGEVGGHLTDPGKVVVELHEYKEIAVGIASGLRFLHSKGIVHRDLKLSNIMVCTTVNSQKIFLNNGFLVLLLRILLRVPRGSTNPIQMKSRMKFRF